MTPEEFRRAMQRYREDIDAEAKALTDPYVTLDRLRGEFRKLDADERSVANEVLGEWALSDDEKLRFDALVLIEELNITTALPVLEELMRRYAKSASPIARHYVNWASRIAAKWADNQGRGGAG
jgi:hypothetical protein